MLVHTSHFLTRQKGNNMGNYRDSLAEINYKQPFLEHSTVIEEGL